MASLTDSLPDTALTRLFAREVADGRAAWFSLPGGASLYEVGEDADRFFLLRAGRLGAFRHEEGHETQFLGVIRPGEPAGEMALIAGSPHSATVTALRDSEVLALSRDEFFRAVAADAAVMTELARLMILRTRQSAAGGVMGEPSVFGFIGLSREVRVRPLVTDLEARIRKLGYRAVVVGSEALRAPTEWFSNVERDHDFVLYAAEAEELAWKALIGRQGDRLFRVGYCIGDPPDALPENQIEPLQEQLVDLVLLHPAGVSSPRGSETWVATMRPARLFHVREGSEADADRLTRVLTGQSVGVVLSGGGARAYAHIGAIRALHDRGVPIDFVGGVSMGAIIGAGVAMGWDDAEMVTRIRKAFVDSSPLDDIALPMIAMTHGERVRERLAEHFDDHMIADLWLPFFCITSNLTTGAYQILRSGLVREALRASISLPGVLPPVTEGNNVLVDGAVLKNYPADVMRAIQLGPIVGVDVGRGRSIEAKDIAASSVWRWLLSGEWRRGPPIVSVLMRSATVRAGPELAQSHAVTDVLVLPEVDAIEIRDWKGGFDPGVKAGYDAMIASLDALEHPVVDLRRRQSLDEAALASRRAPLSAVGRWA